MRHAVKRIWDTSCLDWEKRFLAGEQLVPELPLYADEADRAVRVFRRLRLPDVIDTPRIGEVCGDWICPIVASMFGSYNVDVNERMIQEYFLLVPKKNGKSTFAAAIMVTAILLNRRPSAEFTFLAPTIEVAQIAFRTARAMIRLDPYLTELFHIQDNIRRITMRDKGSFLQIKAADLDIVTGMKPLGTLVDETHVLSQNSRAADVLVEIRGALAARPDGFLLQITTQSKRPPSGIFKTIRYFMPI